MSEKGSEDVLQTDLVADGRGAVLTAAQHHVGVHHQVAVLSTDAEVTLYRARVDHRLIGAENRDFLVAERRHIGNLEARGHGPAADVLFKAV